MGSVCNYRGTLWSALSNPAILAGMKNITTGINYENRFLVRELAIKSVGVIFPSGRSSLGFTALHSGLPDYRIFYGAAACGLQLSEKLSAGARIDLFSIRTYDNFDNIFSIAGELAFAFSPSAGRYAGVSIFNPIPARLRRNDIPSAIRIDGGLLLNENLYTAAGIVFCTDKAPQLRTGFEYSGVKKITIRAGFSTENTSFSFGLGCMTGPLLLDIGFRSHIRLGISSSISLTYNITK